MSFLQRPFALLALLVAFEAWLAADALWQARSEAAKGEGPVIGSDGLGYYAWLRSPLVDGDLSFDNEFDVFNARGHAVPGRDLRTPLGRRWNQWSVGPALVWAAPVAACHAALRALGEPWPADGYSLPYQLTVAVTTFAFGVCGLVWLQRACRLHARPERAALVVVVTVLGTTLVYYRTMELSMAHALGAAALAGCVASWLPRFGEPTSRRWFLLGLGFGWVCLFRWQLATYAVLPLGEAVLCARSFGPRRTLTNLTALGAGGLLGVAPQLIAWKLLFGQWIATPIPVTPHWSDPWLPQALFSFDRGLFYWTPLAMLLFVGAAAAPFLAKGARASLALLFLAFVAQTYVVSSLLGESVYLGASFGFRFLAESLVVLAPGAAATLDRLEGRPLRATLAAAWALVAWNLLLVCQYRHGYVPNQGGAEPLALLRNAVWMLKHRTWLAASHALAAPTILAALSWPLARPPAAQAQVPKRLIAFQTRPRAARQHAG